MKTVLVIHGPNLNLLGKREPEIYGHIGIDDINKALSQTANELKLKLEIHQFDNEGDIVSCIGKAGDTHAGILINPAAYTHTSVAIRDAVSAVRLPTVEVHLSNIYAREDFRHKSLVAPVAIGQVSGFGVASYTLGLGALAAHLSLGKSQK